LGSILNIPLRDGSFDLVTCLDVLQHLPLPEGDLTALRECRRVLRPGGLLLIRANARKLTDADDAAQADYQRYTIEKLDSRLKEAGFQVVRLSYANALDALRERLARGLGERRDQPAAAQQDQGLPLRLLPPHLAWIGALRYAALELEARYLDSEGRGLASGHSTLALARKPGN
jgi:SAM-dependent methyltransferase